MSVGLIDFLRGWGESLFTTKKAYISNQAMPSDSVQEYEYENISEQAFVAPSDGYLTIGSGVSNGSGHCVCWGGIETAVASNENTAIFAPMKKGQTRYFSVTNYRFVRFIPTVGGGD